LKNNKNYYQILHVQPEAPLEVIRSSYRTMMQKLKMHPDLGGDHKYAALINEAHTVLTNPSKRAEYDASLKNVDQHGPNKPANKATQKQPAATASTFSQPGNTEQCFFCQRPHSLGTAIHPESICANCDSPLFPAKKQAMEESGQRAIQRIDKQWPVNFYTQEDATYAYSGLTLNVSLHGILLLTTNPLTDDQTIKIVGKPLDCIARVTNQQKNSADTNGEWRIGLEFLTLLLHNSHGTFVSLSI